ncbi:hypothetical protein, partial [Pseudomonas aeruginosa]|uniref:hypothetical protein n=1 Tax=Pseudomonas aeruginosa TaxID=287 RepID=UPI002237A1EF
MTSTRSASSGSTSGVPCFATCFQNAFSAPGRFSASSACRRCRIGLCGAGESRQRYLDLAPGELQLLDLEVDR